MAMAKKKLTKGEMALRRANLQILLRERGEIGIVPENFHNTVSLKVVGKGEEASVELHAGVLFSRLFATPPVKNVFQSGTKVVLNEDDLEQLADALVQVKYLLAKARVGVVAVQNG